MKPTFKHFPVMILLIALSWSSAAWAVETGEVLVSRLNMRSGPGKQYRVLKQLAQGSRITVIKRHDGWLEVIYEDVQGFIVDDAGFVAFSETPSDSTSPEIEAPEAEKEIKETSPTTETIDMQVQASKNDLETLSAQEQKMMAEFDILSRKLDQTRRQVRNAGTGIAAIEEKIQQINQQSDDLRNQIREQEAYAARRLVALYKLNWLGRVHFLASAGSFFDFITRKSALERILGQDTRLLDNLNDKQNTFDQLVAQLNTSRADKRNLELTLEQTIADLEAQQQQHRAMLDRIRGEKALEVAALTAFEKAASELDETLVIEKSAQRPAKPGSQAGINGQTPFESYKGLLTWPVQGKVISFFGSQHSGKFNVPTFQSGINIQAERGEPIRAVAEGYTIFSSWFNGFGNMIIVDHGRHYYTVYAHLEETFKVKGDWVEKGEVIATVGDSGSMSGPALHFEVRYHGTPEDPLLWIKNG